MKRPPSQCIMKSHCILDKDPETGVLNSGCISELPRSFPEIPMFGLQIQTNYFKISHTRIWSKLPDNFKLEPGMRITVLKLPRKNKREREGGRKILRFLNSNSESSKTTGQTFKIGKEN